MAPYVQLLGVRVQPSTAGSVHQPSGPCHLGWSTDTSGAGGHAGPLVFAESSGPGEHAMMGGMSQLLEDIEMSDSEPASLDGGTHYLALDTNVLIDHLALVRALYTLCRDVGRGRLVLLIPSVVINELDGLSSSSSSSSGASSPARPSLVSSSARSATAFLLSTYRTKSPLPLPDDSGMHPARDSTVAAALRCQRWSERLDRAISKPDDRVLDCCLFFRSREGGRSVTLWTADRNLALLAESNDVRTISGPADLEQALRGLDLNSEDQFWEKLARVCVSGVSRPAQGPDTESVARTEPALGDFNDDDMELDHDLLTDNGLTYRGAHDATFADATNHSNHSPLSRHPHPGDPSADHSSRRYAPILPSSSTSPSSSILRGPSPPLTLPSGIPRIKRIIPHSILSDLTSLFLPISLHLPPPASAPPTTSTFTSTSFSVSPDTAHPSYAPLTVSTPPHLLLSHLLSQLLSAESRLSALSIPLLRTISHLRTIHSFVDPSPSPDARPPRTGEVAEALEELGPLWVALGVACDREEFARVARDVREIT